jgi:hypothetical protein
MAVLVALLRLVELGVVVTLLEVGFSRRSGGDANHGKAAQHHGEGHQSLHLGLLPFYERKAQTHGSKGQKVRLPVVEPGAP